MCGSRHFNPRSRKGSDGPGCYNPYFSGYFNPRSRKGSDLLCRMFFLHLFYFNPRSRKGSDEPGFVDIKFPANNFNPRSRKGSDRLSHSALPSAGNFNPRSRKGSDYNVPIGNKKEVIFQSTLPQGERRIGDEIKWKVMGISIHAPARGATDIFDFIPLLVDISIHAPARGATELLHKQLQLLAKFQSTLPQGERPQL